MTKQQRQFSALAKLIADTVPTERIYLFGSRAYGTPDADSDTDIYVLLKDSAQVMPLDAMFNIRMAIHNSAIEPGALDLVANYASRFEERSLRPTLERKISEDGVVIYG
jgi:predicted nucleotidyltransferase